MASAIFTINGVSRCSGMFGSGSHDAECGTGQRLDPLGMQVGTIHLAHERADIRQLRPPPIRIRHRAAPSHNRREQLHTRVETRLHLQ